MEGLMYMKINDVIKFLENIRESHGNIELFLPTEFSYKKIKHINVGIYNKELAKILNITESKFHVLEIK